MNSTPRILYGFLSKSIDPLNISLPWQISDQDGMFRMNYAEGQATLDNLKAWAHTNWGERPNRFEFGLDARRYLFESIDIAKQTLENNARNQLGRYFPQVQIEQLEIKVNATDPTLEPSQIVFFLQVKIKGFAEKITLQENVGN